MLPCLCQEESLKVELKLQKYAKAPKKKQFSTMQASTRGPAYLLGSPGIDNTYTDPVGPAIHSLYAPKPRARSHSKCSNPDEL